MIILGALCYLQEVKSNKYYWDYKLEGLRVDRVALSAGGSTAIIEATIQESAQLCDQTNPDVDDSYRSTYCARYVKAMDFPPSVCDF